MRSRFLYYTVPAAAANNIALSQTPSGATPLTLNGALVTAGVATLSSGLTTIFTPTGGCWQRRILLTCAADDHLRSIQVVGTILVDGKSYTIGEKIQGSATTTTQSLNDYTTIISLTPDGGSWAGAVTVGTSGVASSPWLRFDTDIPNPFAVGIGCTLVSGAVTFTVEHTFDKMIPNGGSGYIASPTTYAPNVFPNSGITSKSASTDGNYAFPIQAMRLTVNSGAGVVLCQAGQTQSPGGPGSASGEWSV